MLSQFRLVTPGESTGVLIVLHTVPLGLNVPSGGCQLRPDAGISPVGAATRSAARLGHALQARYRREPSACATIAAASARLQPDDLAAYRCISAEATEQQGARVRLRSAWLGQAQAGVSAAVQATRDPPSITVWVAVRCHCRRPDLPSSIPVASTVPLKSVAPDRGTRRVLEYVVTNLDVPAAICRPRPWPSSCRGRARRSN